MASVVYGSRSFKLLVHLHTGKLLVCLHLKIFGGGGALCQVSLIKTALVRISALSWPTLL